MTERLRAVLPGLMLAGLVLVLVAAALYLGRDEYRALMDHDAERPATQSAESRTGSREVTLGEDSRRAAGLELAALAAADTDGELRLSGVVADVRPLLEAGGRQQSQSEEIRALRAQSAQLDTELRRLEALYRDERNVSERAVQQAEAEARAARARLAGAESGLRAARDALAAEWGAAVAEMALNPAGQLTRALRERREVLALVAWPAGAGGDAPPATLRLGPAGSSAAARAARLAEAPAALPGVSGPTWFYRVPAAGLRTGTRLAGWAGAGPRREAGVVIPEPAVVWHAGRAWVYVLDEDQPGTFERVSVEAQRLVPGGWLQPGGLEPGRQVVVTGAQLLLSEELESQIRNENED